MAYWNPGNRKLEEDDQNGQGVSPSNPQQQVEQQMQPQMNREQWRDAWMGAGQMTPEAADQWLSSHGAQQLGEKAGVWRTPSGDVLDLQIGRGGAKATGGKITPGWTQVGDSSVGGNGGGGQMPQQMDQMSSGIGPPMNRMQQFMQMYGGTGIKQRQNFNPS